MAKLTESTFESPLYSELLMPQNRQEARYLEPEVVERAREFLANLLDQWSRINDAEIYRKVSDIGFWRVINLTQNGSSTQVTWKYDFFQNLAGVQKLGAVAKAYVRQILEEQGFSNTNGPFLEVFEQQRPGEAERVSHIYDLSQKKFLVSFNRTSKGELSLRSSYKDDRDGYSQDDLFVRLLSGKAGGPVSEMLASRLSQQFRPLLTSFDQLSRLYPKSIHKDVEFGNVLTAGELNSIKLCYP